MVESGEVRPIECACRKAMIWASEAGIEWQCRDCGRKVLVPFRELRGLEHVQRFMSDWRDEERGRGSGRTGV